MPFAQLSDEFRLVLERLGSRDRGPAITCPKLTPVGLMVETESVRSRDADLGSSLAPAGLNGETAEALIERGKRGLSVTLPPKQR